MGKQVRKHDCTLRVFVYGTLQQGYGNHALCTGRGDSTLARVQQASTALGDLYYCYEGGGFPYLVASRAALHGVPTGSWDVMDDMLAQARMPVTLGDADAFGKVHGQLLTFHGSLHGMRQRLRGLDGLEGFRPDSLYHSHYWRVLLPVMADDGRVYHAWVYARNPLDGPLPEAQRIPGGRWVPKYTALRSTRVSYASAGSAHDLVEEMRRLLLGERGDD